MGFQSNKSVERSQGQDHNLHYSVIKKAIIRVDEALLDDRDRTGPLLRHGLRAAKC